MAKKKNNIQVIQSAEEQIAKASIERDLAIQNALQSSDIDEIYKAQTLISQIEKKDPKVEYKSMIIDPQQAWGANGYKNKSFNLSYEMLRAMGRTPIIKAIIETRKEQILSFCEPQQDRYSTGFIVRPKKYKLKNGKMELSKEEQMYAENITEFILNCGTNSNAWHGDDFNSFSRKFIDDCLKLDQGTFEIVADRRGIPVEFFATDGATYRIADSNNDQGKLKDREQIQGYYPYYVQVYQGKILQEFYPWELCFAIRNPQSSIYQNGYGRSELEDLIENITAMLNADQYNSNYFKVGSNPKGILKVSGNVNPGRMEEFKTHWQATMAGVRNAHKLPIIEADKMDFISTQQSNKDMEYAKYQEFLIKVACAHYKIDPSEINFPMQGASEGGGGLFEGSNEARLKHSKDKGLIPLLKAKQNWENKYIISRLNPDWELVYVGLDSDDRKTEIEKDIKAVQNYMTVNEIRAKHDMEPYEGGDIILNPIIAQQQMMQMQMQAGMNNPTYDSRDYQEGQPQEEDPFSKALMNDLDKIFNKD